MSQEKDSRAYSSRDDENWMYLKPVSLYDMLLRHFPCKPWFLRRNLNYKYQQNCETRSASAGMVVFNFKDLDNTVKKTQVTKNCSCPFCYMQCGSFKGLQLHLNSFHKILEFEFMTSEENQTVDVTARLDAFETEVIFYKLGNLGKPYKLQLLKI
ncbi:Polycomb group protein VERNALIZATION 2 [Raphanus sativus]|nr:Polycomb group protein VERNALIZATION 2 [Raphanus sativus]